MIVLKRLWNIALVLLEFILENPFIIVGAVWLLIIWGIINNIRTSRKYKKLIKALASKPTNENVKKYTDFLRKITVNNHPSSWNALRQTYNGVKDLESIDYDLRLQLCEVLKKKGTSGIHPPRQYNYQDKEERIRQAGREGEKQVAYALKWLDKKRFKVFNNIKLSAGGESQEFDSIVVGDRAVFNIETKNYIGNLTIDQDGNWYRIVNGHKTGTENPIFQVKRHHKVLDDLLEGRLPIVDLLVWTNIESVIEGAHNSSVKIIKVDQLTYFIESYNKGSSISKKEIDFAVARIRRQ